MQKAPPYVTVIIAGAIFLTLGYWLGTARNTDPERVGISAGEQLARAGRQIVDPERAEREERERKNAESAEDQRRALSQRKKQDAVDLAKRGTDLYDEALAEEARWNTEVEALRTNEDGRFIVSEAALTEFETAYKKDRASRDALLAGKAGIESLIAPVKRTLDDPTVAGPLPALLDELRAEKEKAAAAGENYRNARLAIEALVLAGKKAGQRGDSTLADALDTLHRNQQAAANADATRIDQERIDRERAEREARERFLATARDPVLLAKFQPFLAKGRYTGGKISNSEFLEEHGLLFDYPRPMSYQAITAASFYNVLNDFNLFYRMGCGLNEFGSNDRPKWHKPRNDSEMQEYRNRWQDFKYYAQTWRELGILSK